MTNEITKIKFRITLDQIMCVECEPNTAMTLDDGRKSTQCIGEMLNYKPLPMLCDLTNVVKMSRDCRQHFAGPEHAAVFSKCALIVSSPIGKIIGNFFLEANKPLRPTRLFTDKDDAMKWLRNRN